MDYRSYGKKLAYGKKLTRELQDSWESMVQMERLHPEIAYRVHKLGHRITPLADHIFFKTIKARQLLAECSEKTVALQKQIESNGNHVFFLLTNLEKTFEGLVRKTYEFRVKAG
jgi:hypothetical protein